MSPQYVVDSVALFLDTIPVNSRIVIGLSGGVDSVVLAHALVHSNHLNTIQFNSVYIHHGLQSEADSWANFTEKFSQKHKLSHKTIKVTLASSARKGLEAVARDARYKALFAECEQDGYLLTAHHQQDQVETLLLNLFRGTGIKGMQGMPSLKLNPKNKVFHARPLLNVSKDSILDYAKKHNLVWIEDPSNLDNNFKRNYLRNELKPKIRQGWSAVDQSLIGFAKNMQETQGLLDELAQLDLAKCNYASLWLNLDSIRNLSWARQKNVILFWLTNHAYCSVRFTQAIFEWLELSLKIKNNNAHAKRMAKDFTLRIERNLLYVLPRYSESYQVELKDFNPFDLGFSETFLLTRLAVLKKEYLGKNAFVRSLTPADTVANKQLKKQLKSKKTNLWNRDRWPVLIVNSELVEIVGIVEI